MPTEAREGRPGVGTGAAADLAASKIETSVRREGDAPDERAPITEAALAALRLLASGEVELAGCACGKRHTRPIAAPARCPWCGRVDAYGRLAFEVRIRAAIYEELTDPEVLVCAIAMQLIDETGAEAIRNAPEGAPFVLRGKS